MSTINIFEQIECLVQYGIQKKLISGEDVDYVRNRLLELLQIEKEVQVEVQIGELQSPQPILDKMLDWAYDQEILKINSITYRDLLDTKIMDCLMPRPSELIKQFQTYYDKDQEVATSYFYQLSQHSNYIRTDRIAKNEHWYSETKYGNLEITINLAKPEKDPEAIAVAKEVKQLSYPKCLLCKENVGYKGRLDHPARQNHRIIPVQLSQERWYFQFSPYVYYNEHAIIFSKEHKPMQISKDGFERLLHFIDQFPHYFVGTNADLPIVGGSILSHDHFQGGRHEFPMALAEIEERFHFFKYPDIVIGIVNWPMSVIRISGPDRHKLVSLGEDILQAWRVYSDEAVDVLAFTNEQPHNTITPIARKRGENFELDLVLRNNRTSAEHPLGIYHPHAEVHHIKKENIGLIEVMGLAVLPGRLQEEMEVLAEYLVNDNVAALIEDVRTAKHHVWAEKLKTKYDKFDNSTIREILKNEIGFVFSTVLEHAGVFKRDVEGKKAFKRFIYYVESTL